MKTLMISGIAVCMLAVTASYYTALLQRKNDTPAPHGPTACTMEALICPDGTAVGRVGPYCEFAPCPAPTSPEEGAAAPATFTLALNEAGRTRSLTVVPTQVVEDSRCAQDAQCIWAGRVVVRATIGTAMGTSTMDFAIGTLMTTEVDTIVLRDVTPHPRSTGSISPSDYRFVFEVTPR